MIDSNLKPYEEIKLSSKDRYKGKYESIIVILDCNSTFYFLQYLKDKCKKIIKNLKKKKTMVLAQKQKCRPMEQDREGPETNPCTYGQLIHDKGGKNIQ